MAQKDKVLVTDDGRYDMSMLSWDDHRFSQYLVRESPLKPDQALDVSRGLREQLEKLDLTTITLPVIERMLEAKLMEYGLPPFAPIRLNKNLLLPRDVNLSDNAITVLERRYLKRDAEGNLLESPEQMFRRVANHVARSEEKYGDPEQVEQAEAYFYKMMTELKFLPNSPTLMNAGRQLGQLAACFVLPIEDSMEGIFDALKNAALIHKSGGGTGFSFSRLRPQHSRVGSTGGVASGPVSFMRIFNTATEQVKQGGTRRGANMAILRIDHPDILEFIDCKADPGEMNNFNISVGVTEAFMQSVKADKGYDLIDPLGNRKVGELSASQVFRRLVERAWETGDPGIIFLDRINADNPTPDLGEIESTNPCGEQPLLPLEACNLGSINLAKFIQDEDGHAVVDYEGLKDIVWWAVRFLDDTIDASRYPLDEITQMVRGNRKVGLGVMGFADMLYQLGIPYDSEQALEMGEEVMAFIQKQSHRASQDLAEKRGSFKNFDQSSYKGKNGSGMRNATATTIAPTGTLSIIAGCSSGIEPLFALSFVRNVMDNDKLLEVNPYFEKIARERGFYSRELMDTIAAQGSIRNLERIPKDVRDVFVTAHDVVPEWHIRMQAAFQKHTDNAVSKTVNLPHDATVADVRKVYGLAYDLGCKGVTIYRDGSKENQVLSFSGQKTRQEAFFGAVKKRPETLEGFTTRIKTGLGQLYVTVTEYDGQPFEVFATIGKSGRSTTAKTEAIGRLVSLALRAGVQTDRIVNQLKGIGGEHPVFQEGGLVLSIPDAISRVLENRYLKDNNNVKTVKSLMGETCPDCGQTVSFEEGCMTCHFCGFSKCG